MQYDDDRFYLSKQYVNKVNVQRNHDARIAYVIHFLHVHRRVKFYFDKIVKERQDFILKVK